VSENGVLKGLCGSNGIKVAAGWRKLHSEELHNMHSVKNIVRGIMQGRVREANHVYLIGEMRNAC
jgi:hypothetical protein